MFLDQIDKFFSRFKKYFLKYKNGFYEIPYLANSPESIVASFKKMPFMKWDDSKKKLNASNPFLSGEMFCYKLEDGLWLILADVTYKVNVHYRFIYDKYLPANYYLLSFNTLSHTSINKVAVLNGLSFQTFSWNLLKPKAGVTQTNFKGSTVCSVGLYISENWAKEHLFTMNQLSASKLEGFFSSSVKSVVWPDLNPETNDFFIRTRKVLNEDFSEEKNVRLKSIASEFLDHLIKIYSLSHSPDQTVQLKSETQIKLMKIEKALRESLFTDFLGIEALSEKFGISSTKLKQDFKLLYGESIFQYYRNRQLDYAKTLIIENKMKIHEISELLGYNSESKFSAAFKKRHSVLPSVLSKAERSGKSL